MYTRVLVPLDGSTDDETALALVETAASSAACPVHLVSFIDVSPLTHFGVHGPTVNIAQYCVRIPPALHKAERYLKFVAQALTDRGICATYEIRRGLLEFELPAAIRPGDLVVTQTRQYIRSEPAGVPRPMPSPGSRYGAGKSSLSL